jgi:hypothetical protein
MSAQRTPQSSGVTESASRTPTPPQLAKLARDECRRLCLELVKLLVKERGGHEHRHHIARKNRLALALQWWQCAFEFLPSEL